MKVFQRQTELRTSGDLTVRDITEEVVDAVRESGEKEEPSSKPHVIVYDAAARADCRRTTR